MTTKMNFIISNKKSINNNQKVFNDNIETSGCINESGYVTTILSLSTNTVQYSYYSLKSKIYTNLSLNKNLWLNEIKDAELLNVTFLNNHF